MWGTNILTSHLPPTLHTFTIVLGSFLHTHNSFRWIVLGSYLLVDGIDIICGSHNEGGARVSNGLTAATAAVVGLVLDSDSGQTHIYNNGSGYLALAWVESVSDIKRLKPGRR